jgi:hypothetical protein
MAAVHQALAVASTMLSEPWPLNRDDGALIRKPINPKAHTQENSKGTTAGEGPKVNGLSQGSVMRKNGIRGRVSAGINGGVTSQVDLHRTNLAGDQVGSFVEA